MHTSSAADAVPWRNNVPAHAVGGVLCRSSARLHAERTECVPCMRATNAVQKERCRALRDDAQLEWTDHAVRSASSVLFCHIFWQLGEDF